MIQENASSTTPTERTVYESVLLTGASGYIGGHIVRALRRRGYSVRALLRKDSSRHDEKTHWLEGEGVEVVDGDLRDAKALRTATRGVDSIIHSAAVLGMWSRQNNLQYHVNVDGTAALMRVALRHKIERVVHVSSIAAIGATREPRSMNEGEAWSWSHRPNVHYALSKRESEERCRHALRNGLPVVVVNPAAVLGRPAQGGEFRGILRGAMEGRPWRLPPGGTSFAHVSDVAESIVTALERGRVGERYLLGGVNLSWPEFYGAVARALGAERHHPTWPLVLGRGLSAGALLLDGVGLSRPPWAPERFRIWGWYGYADSTKARRELDHRLPSIEEILTRVFSEAPTPALLTPTS